MMLSITEGSVSAKDTGISCEAPTLLTRIATSSLEAETMRSMLSVRVVGSAASATTVLVGMSYFSTDVSDEYSSRTELLGDVGEGGLTTANEDDAKALGCELAGELEANASCTACYDGPGAAVALELG